MTSVALAALVAAGCGTGTNGPTGSPARGTSANYLYLERHSRVVMLAADTGRAVWTSSDAVVTPDLTRAFVLKGGRLIALDPAAGTDDTMQAPEGFRPAVASPSGTSVALVEEERTDTPYDASDRTRTTLVVARLDDGALRRYRLRGDFEPEAFSTDDRHLFLIEFHSRTRYSVRMMDLGSGRVLPIGRLTKVAPRSMRGTGRVQAYSPDGSVLYTLYTRQPPNYVHRSPAQIRNGENVHAFVHVLDLAEGWAHCIDLPAPFGRGGIAESLAVSPDGDSLFVGDGEHVASIDTSHLDVVDVSEAGSDGGYGSHAAVGWDSRLYVAGGSAITVIDGPSLNRLDRFSVGGPIGAITVAPDGTELFVSVADEVVVLDSATGTVQDRFAALGAERIAYRADR